MVYGILHRADHLHLVIGDFDVEGFFHGDYQFRDVERVGAEIFQKGGAGNDGFGGRVQLVSDDVDDLFFDGHR